MADEENTQESVETGAESKVDGSEGEGSATEAAAKVVETRPEKEEPDEPGFSVLGLAFLALTGLGLYSLIGYDPSLKTLGIGLVGFGIVDLVNSLRQKTPGGQKSWTLVLNILRTTWFILFGGYALLTGFGIFNYPGFDVFILAWAVFGVVYLCLAMLAELLSKDKVEVGPVLLMGSLMLMGLSYFFFSVRFHLLFAGILALVSLIFAALALWRGALNSNRSLALTMLVALLLLVTPFAGFSIQHMIEETQPIISWYPLVGQEHLEHLGKQAEDLKWAPAFKGHSGDATLSLEGRQSSKIEFAYMKEGKRFLFMYNENRNNPEYDKSKTAGQVKIYNLHPDAEGFWWSPDSTRLAFSHFDRGSESRALVVADERTEKLAQIGGLEDHPEESAPSSEELYEQVNYRKMNAPDVVSDNKVWPMVENHGQIWSLDSHEILYAAPVGDHKEYVDNIKDGKTRIWKANLKTQRVEPLTSGASKVYPAWAPDESRIAYVTFKPGTTNLEMARGDGSNRRIFQWRKEQRFFPAWNAAQNKVLYVKDGSLVLMDANGTNGRDFQEKHARDDKVWFTADKEKFLLEFTGVPDKWRIMTMDPDGGRQRKLYEAECDEIFPPVWSPDSQRIAFVQRENDNVYSIYNMGRDGDREGDWAYRFFTSRDKIRDIKWSPQSNKLAFFVGRKDAPVEELWTVNQNPIDRDQTAPQKVIEQEGHMRALSWSKDQQFLAFEHLTHWKLFGARLINKDIFQVKIVDLAKNTVRPILPFSSFGRQPAFSPNGSMLAFVGDANRYMPDKDASILIVRLQ